MSNQLTIEITEIEETIAGMIAVHFGDFPNTIVHDLQDKVNKCAIVDFGTPTGLFTDEVKRLPIRQQSCLTALTYWYLAVKQRDAENLADAWKFLCKSSYFIGLTDGREEPRVVAAARGRSEKSQWKKLQVANLISGSRPVDGWKTERDAANSILEEVISPNKKLEMNLTKSRLGNLITGWMKEDGSVVRDAFLGTYVNDSD